MTHSPRKSGPIGLAGGGAGGGGATAAGRRQNGDGADRPVLKDGKVERFLRINFVHCERLANFDGADDQAGTSTPVPVWAKSGAYLGIWGDIATEVSRRNDIQGVPWQAYCKQTIGATRLEEKKVVKVWCR